MEGEDHRHHRKGSSQQTEVSSQNVSLKSSKPVASISIEQTEKSGPTSSCTNPESVPSMSAGADAGTGIY